MSPAPYLKFAGPVLDEATIAGVADVLRSGWITSGPRVQEFERALSAFCGGRPVKALTSATAAVEVALQLAGIGPGDEVITSAQSFFTVLNMIVKVGATPVFVDCDLVTRNIDLGAGRGGDHAAHQGDRADALAGLAGRHGRAPCARAGARPARDRGRGAGDGIAVAGTQHRRHRRPRHVQLPSEQEHDDDRGRRARRQRRRRGRARRCAALSRHHLPARPHARRRVSRRQVQPARRQRAGSAVAQLDAAARVPGHAPRARRALFRALRDRPAVRAAAAAARRRRPVVEHVLGAAAARPADGHAQGVARRARRARHRHRRIVRGAPPVHAGPPLRLPGRRFAGDRADRARNGDAAAARRHDGGRRRPRLRRAGRDRGSGAQRELATQRDRERNACRNCRNSRS